MSDAIQVLEIGSDEFNELQQRIRLRAEQRDVPITGRSGELMAAARDTDDAEFIKFVTEFFEGMHPTVMGTVERIIQRIEAEGDEALRHLVRLFDGKEVPTAKLKVSKMDLMQAADGADQELLDLCVNKVLPRLRAYHERQTTESWQIDEDGGGSIGLRAQPLHRVGLYVPGGTAFYPSSLMMTVVPAQQAGVEEIAVFTPPKALEETPMLAALLLELNIEEVYRVGGAHAVAAAAIGTENVPRVDKFVGPGNIFVAIAKQMLSHRVGIDSFAGPSEVVVLFDAKADPALVAADLLAQAEHDVHAAAIGITDSEDAAKAVQKEVGKQLESLPRNETAAQSLNTYGGIMVAPSMGFAARLADSLAPEHCEVLTEDAEKLAAGLRNAGAIFVGPYAPEAFGDYNAGPNHVLPTGGSARWASLLRVNDFVRQVSVVRGSKELLQANQEAATKLARAEGLEAHARSIEARFKQ
jgi:histidinol dehydrogenase